MVRQRWEAGVFVRLLVSCEQRSLLLISNDTERYSLGTKLIRLTWVSKVGFFVSEVTSAWVAAVAHPSWVCRWPSSQRIKQHWQLPVAKCSDRVTGTMVARLFSGWCLSILAQSFTISSVHCVPPQLMALSTRILAISRLVRHLLFFPVLNVFWKRRGKGKCKEQ